MEIAVHSNATPIATRNFKPVPLLAIGGLVSFLLIFNGFLFRTYSIAMESAPWEAARQFGLPYILAEIGVILYAIRQGLNLRDLWSKLPRALQYCSAFFLATFWVGGAMYSEVALPATLQNLIFLLHPLFAVAVYHLIARIDAAGLRGLVLALAIGLIIFCGMTAVAFINHPPLSSMPNNEIIWQFIIPGFISVRLFGAFCGAIFCVLLAQLLLNEETAQKRFLPYVWLTLCGAMTIWSGTRNAVLGIMVAMAVMLIIYRLRPTGFKSVGLLVLSATIAYWLAVSLIPYDDPAFMLISSQDSASTESISGGRASYWRALWNAYQSVPIFGAGPFASFWILPVGEQVHVQPHNIIVQFLLSWGFSAALAALILLAYATFHAHRVGLKHRNILPFLAMLDSLLVMSFFDGTVHFAQPLMLIMISFGVIFSAHKTEAEPLAG